MLVLLNPKPAAAHDGTGETGWQFAPLPLALSAVSLVLVLAGVVRLHRRGRGDLAPAWRFGMFAAAVGLVCVVLFSPIDSIGESELLSVHMFQHVVLGDLAPALALVALRGPLLFFVLPAVVLGVLARTSWVRRLFAFLVFPATSYVVWVLALAVWHLPPAYELAVGNPLAHDLEHLSFLVGGLLIWFQLVDPARRRALSINGRLLFLLLVFAAGQALAITLIAQPDPIYSSYDHVHEGRFGLTPSADQDYAGLVMMAEQLLTLGICAALLIRLHMRDVAPSPDSSRHPLAR